MKNKIFTSPVIRGVSVTVPKERLSIKNLNFDGVNLDEVTKITGVEEVRRAPKNMTVTDYAINAAENLFSTLNFDKNEIDGIIFETPISDYLTPGNGYVMQERLSLKKNCVIVDINQACAGFVNGLFQASLLIQSGYCKNILLCAGDTAATVHPKDKSMQTLMGDAAAVAIISAGESESAFSFYNDGNLLKALYIPAGGRRSPIKHNVTDVEKADENGNIRTLASAHMDGLEVMAFAISAAPKAIKEVFGIMNWTKDDVEIFALHQASKPILTALTKRLRLSAEKVPITLTNFGNTAGASIPLTLCLENSNAFGKWSRAILCAFGNGMACAAAALDFSKTYFCEVHEF